MPTGTQTPQNILSTFTPFGPAVLSTHGTQKQALLVSAQPSTQESVDVVSYPDSAVQWLVSLFDLLAGLVNRSQDLSHVGITETEYQQLSAVLDDLIYGVGEDENHSLSAAMALVGVLIKMYEDQHFPKLVNFFPELAKDTSVEATGESGTTVATISGQIETDFAAAFFSIGYLFSAASKEEKAISAYDFAIQLKPDYVHAYANRGVAKYTLDNYEGAVEDHSKAIELDPDYAGHYTNRGNAKSGLRDYKGAIADHTKTIQLMPNFHATYVNRGNVRFRLGEYESAIGDYTKAIDLNQNFAGVYINRAKAKTRLSRIAEAKSDLQSALKLAIHNNDDNLRSGIEHMIHELNEIG